MSNQEKSPSTWRQFKDTLENINHLTGLIAAVIATLTFATGNRVASYVFVLLAGASLDWLIWRRLNQLPPTHPGLVLTISSGKSPQASPRRGRQILAATLIGLVTILALGWITINGQQDLAQIQTDALRAQGYFAPTATPSQKLILLVEFEPGGSKKYETNKRIYDQLNEQTQNAHLSDTAIVQIPLQPGQTYTPETIRALGQRHQAVFVVWGWYDDNGIAPKFTIIRSNPQPLIEAQTREVLAEPSRDFSLYISQGLPLQMTYLALFTLGQLQYYDQQYDQALATLDQATEIRERSLQEGALAQPASDGSPQLFFLRAYIRQYFKARPTEAIADYTRALDLDPRLVDAYKNRGVAYRQQNQLERALADYNQAITLDPNYAPVFNNRGNVYRDQHKLDLAIADYTRAIALDPHNAVPISNRGMAYLDQGHWDQALQDFNQAIALNPGYANPYYSRGYIYMQQGLALQARGDFESYLQLNPTAPNRTQVEQYLKQLR